VTDENAVRATLDTTVGRLDMVRRYVKDSGLAEQEARVPSSTAGRSRPTVALDRWIGMPPATASITPARGCSSCCTAPRSNIALSDMASSAVRTGTHGTARRVPSSSITSLELRRSVQASMRVLSARPPTLRPLHPLDHGVAVAGPVHLEQRRRVRLDDLLHGDKWWIRFTPWTRSTA
jgi:hypothetical protein